MTAIFNFGAGKVLVTNDGKHSAEALARLIPENLIQIMSTASDLTVREAAAFTEELHIHLTQTIADLQAKEQDNITAGNHGENSHTCHLHGYDCQDKVEQTLAKIVQTAEKYSFRDHFQKDFVQEHIKNVLGNHFSTAMHIERHHFHTSNGR